MDQHTLYLLVAIVLGVIAVTGVFVIGVNIVLNWIKKG